MVHFKEEFLDHLKLSPYYFLFKHPVCFLHSTYQIHLKVYVFLLLFSLCRHQPPCRQGPCLPYSPLCPPHLAQCLTHTFSINICWNDQWIHWSKRHRHTLKQDPKSEVERRIHVIKTYPDLLEPCKVNLHHGAAATQDTRDRKEGNFSRDSDRTWVTFKKSI